MVIQGFSIVFDSPERDYLPEQTVTGQVIVRLDAPKNTEGVYLEATGKAEVDWLEGKGGIQYSQNTASESYFSYATCLFKGSDKSELPEGEHCFPFSFTLPANIPSSFEGHWGSIRYIVQARLVRTWHLDHTVKLPFLVKGISDLNNDPSALVSACAKNDKYLFCLCCSSGPISIKARIAKSGYIPGEAIRIDAEIQNNSVFAVKGVKAILNQRSRFFAKERKRTVEKTVAEVKRSSISPRQTQTWTGVPLVVPQLPPSSLSKDCGIIDIDYQLHMIVNPSGPSFRLWLTIPIIIGSIAIADSKPVAKETVSTTKEKTDTKQ